MRTNKQTQELSDKIAQIECFYNNLHNYFNACLTKSDLLDKIGETLDKAKAWDVYRAKCGKGGKVAGKNLSKKERIERARKASRSRECVQGKKKGRRTTKKSSI